ncbi:MAG TPA: hypothetical protein VFT22_35540 [Kofleriaceae bacterium]|nr:hypothetical protein [Kofleriaceae bacterium]
MHPPLPDGLPPSMHGAPAIAPPLPAPPSVAPPRAPTPIGATDPVPGEVVTEMLLMLMHGDSAKRHVASSPHEADTKMILSSGKGDIGVLDSAEVTRALAQTIARALWQRSATVRRRIGNAVDTNGTIELQFEGTEGGDLVVDVAPTLNGWIGTPSSTAAAARLHAITFQRMTLSLSGSSTGHWYPIGRLR